MSAIVNFSAIAGSVLEQKRIRLRFSPERIDKKVSTSKNGPIRGKICVGMKRSPKRLVRLYERRVNIGSTYNTVKWMEDAKWLGSRTDRWDSGWSCSVSLFWLLFYVGTVFRLYSSRVNNRHWNALNSPMDRGFNTSRQLAKLRGTRQTVPFYRHLWRVLHALFIIGNEISSSYTVDFSRFNLWFLSVCCCCVGKWKIDLEIYDSSWDETIILSRSEVKKRL